MVPSSMDTKRGFPPYHFGDPRNKEYIILGSILGSPCFGKLPNGEKIGYWSTMSVLQGRLELEKIHPKPKVPLK